MKIRQGKFIFLCMLSILLIFAACAGGNDYENGEEAAYASIEIAEVPEPEEIEPEEPDYEEEPDEPEFVETNPIMIPVAINLTPAPDPEPSPWTDAAEMVAQMRVGWNLGNTLDAHNAQRVMDPIRTHETHWGNPVTTPENIETIQNAGFDVLRVPVTWGPRLVPGCPDFSIRADWMERVVEVVDYGMDLGMFVIVNIHHDERMFGLFDDDMENSIHFVSRIWEQVSYVFRDYSHMLIFEGLNEPRTLGSAREWSGGTREERRNVNVLNQAFVDTVRASGGNNTNRMLMVPTYAAAVLNSTIEDFVLPTDPANDENKLIASLHMYAPYFFTLTLGGGIRTTWYETVENDVTPIITGLDLAYWFLWREQGIPIIMGEMGALNRDNVEHRAAWVEFYMREAAERGIVCIWWDNGRWDGVSMERAHGDFFGILDRNTNTFPFPEIIEAIMRATESRAG